MTAGRGALAILILGAVLRADKLADAIRETHFSEALRIADESLRQHPGDFRLMTAKGLALAGLHRTTESLAVFDVVLRARPDYVPALQGAAQTSYAARDPHAASLVDRLLELRPDDGTANGMAAILAFEAGNVAMAIKRFEAGRITAESNPQAYFIYGKCLSQVGRANDASVVFEQLSRTSVGSAEILRNLAIAQAAGGRPEAAAKTLGRALEAGPDDEQSYVDLVALYIDHALYDRAMPIVQTGLLRLPKSARLVALRAIIESENGLAVEAERDFDLANELDPRMRYGAAGSGVLLTGSGHADQAVELLRSRLRTSPNDPTLNYLLADALMKAGAQPRSPQSQEAETALYRALQGRPDFADAHALLGKIYRQKGNDRQAIQELQVAVRLDGSNRAALSQLAAALRSAGRTNDAKEISERLRELVIKASGSPKAP